MLDRLRDGDTTPGGIAGWAEAPRYDPASQRLDWATASVDPPSIACTTCTLGREGWFCASMTASRRELEALGPAGARQVATLEFLPGKRHADYDAASDRVADRGLAALVVADAQPPTLAARAARHVGWIAAAAAAVAALGAVLVLALRRKPRTI
jgi:uncharacterized membrane-anchored protein